MTIKQKSVKMIKINKGELEGCSYCSSQISIEYDIKCLKNQLNIGLIN